MTVKKIAIISLSRGLLGEPFIKHEEDIGFKRLHKSSKDKHFTKGNASNV